MLVSDGKFTTPSSGSAFTIPSITFYTPSPIDSDNDGLTDIAEFILGTDPNNPDTDADGVLDGAEVLQGTDPLSGKAVRTGIIGTAPVDGTALDVVAQNDLAVIACLNRGISIFNIFNGMNPTLIAKVDSTGTAQRVALSGTMVALADGAGLALIDISDPPASKIVKYLSLGGTVQSVAAAGSLAFAGLSSAQVVVVDLKAMTEIARVSVPAPVVDLTVNGDYLFALSSDRFHVISMQDGAFSYLRSVPSPVVATASTRLAAGGGVLYVVHGKGYNTFNITDPTQPTLIKASNTTQFGWRQIALNGSGLIVAAVDQNSTFDGPNDISLYDASNPANTDQFITTFITPGLSRSVAIYNGQAYVADSPAGIEVINYLSYDNKKVPPAITLRASFPLAPAASEEGKNVWVEALVQDDVQVRNVEFYVDGTKLATDGNFPFEFRFVTPQRTAQKNNFSFRARAFDTGGNATWTPELLVNLVPDATPPRVTRVFPAPSSLSGSVDSLTASFSEPIQPGTLNSTSFQLVSAGPDKILGTADDLPITNGTLTYRDSLNAAVMQFSSVLPPGNYQATIAGPIADRAGNIISPSFSWRFRIFDKVDTDHDGIPDEIEVLLGLDPNKADTDGNGIPDGQEDFDHDGLPNAAEIFLGLDPRNPDTDGNGIKDGDEDADHDGLTNRQEWLAGTDPTLADTDGDGWNDEAEVTAGSNPLDPNSKPKLFVMANPVVHFVLPEFSSGASGNHLLVLAQPKVSLGVGAFTGKDLALGTVLAQPPVHLGLAAFGVTNAPLGTILALPPVHIGLAAFSTNSPLNTLLATPPVKIKISP